MRRKDITTPTTKNTIMKKQNHYKGFVAFLLSMLLMNMPGQAQTSDNDAALAVEKFNWSLAHANADNQDERVKAFQLLQETAESGVMEACALIGYLCEEEGQYADAAMYYLEALKMKIVAYENDEDIRETFNDSRRGFLRSTLIDATSKTPMENKAVDMGLSVQWANGNYQASNIEDAGRMMSHADAVNIAANGYRLPTAAEWEELMNECIWMPAVVRGVSGFMVFGKGESTLVYGKQPDNVLFLPGGFEDLVTYKEDGKDGYYWTSDCADETTSRFFTFYNDNTLDTGSASKELKFCIRLVKSR